MSDLLTRKSSKHWFICIRCNVQCLPHRNRSCLFHDTTSCLLKCACECMLSWCRLAPLSMPVSWEARALMPTRQLSLVTLLVIHSRTLQAHLSTFSSSSWLSSLWCLLHFSRLTPGRASSSSTSMLESRLTCVCLCKGPGYPYPAGSPGFYLDLDFVLCALLLLIGLSGVQMSV